MKKSRKILLKLYCEEFGGLRVKRKYIDWRRCFEIRLVFRLSFGFQFLH